MSLERCSSQRAHNRIIDELNDDNNSYPQHPKLKRKKATGNCLLLELPGNVICDILSWLPVDTICSCKCVCKTFVKILRDPYFATLHLARSSDIDYRLIIPETVSPFNICLLPVLDLERSSSQSRWQTLAIPNTLSQPTICISLIGSYNGLVCIRHKSQNVIDICVCNPILGEFMTLPQPWPRGTIKIFGFGFCPNTKQYKVIRFRSGLSCEIFTLGTNEWRRIGNVQPLKFPSISMDSSLNGILHCVVGLDTTIRNKIAIRYKICSFNLETEQFSYISLPAHIEKEKPKMITSMKTGILKGLLCVYYRVDGIHLEICVMKQYGVIESWTKILKLYIEFDRNRYLGIYPVKILNNGGLLFTYDCKYMFYYSSPVGTMRNLNGSKPFLEVIGYVPYFSEAIASKPFPEVIGYVPYFSEAIGHVPSLISLKRIAGEENVELVRRTKFTINNEADSTRGCDKFIITREFF